MKSKKILVFDEDANKLSLMLGDSTRASTIDEIAPGVRCFYDANGELLVVEIFNPQRNLDKVIEVYSNFFIGSKYYMLNQALALMGLRGLGILNYENDIVSGESHFLNWFSQKIQMHSPVVLDIGGNVGKYSLLVRNTIPSARIFSFEPHPESFKKLQKVAEENNFVAVNKGCGKEEGLLDLFDYEDNPGSSHASMYRESIEQLRDSAVKPTQVQITTVDQIFKEFHLEHVQLIKIDTEGMELDVLRGASEVISQRLVDVVQFEFNEMNVYSRSFFADFEAILPGYKFFRLLPDGFMEIGKKILWRELFAFQNIVAIEENLI